MEIFVLNRSPSTLYIAIYAMEIFVLNRSPSTLYIAIYAMEIFVLNRSFFEFPTANFFEKKKDKHFVRESHEFPYFYIFVVEKYYYKYARYFYVL